MPFFRLFLLRCEKEKPASNISEQPTVSVSLQQAVDDCVLLSLSSFPSILTRDRSEEEKRT